MVAGAYPAIDIIEPVPGGFKGSLIIEYFNCIQDAEDWSDT